MSEGVRDFLESTSKKVEDLFGGKVGLLLSDLTIGVRGREAI